MFKLSGTFKIITIDQNYLRALYNHCSEVFYRPSNYDNKPYLGILVDTGSRKYAIPLTSAKQKHTALKNVDNGRIVIYEDVNPNALSKSSISKPNPDGTAKHIISVLVIQKMIPIKDNVYSVVNINPMPGDAPDVMKYKNLLNKEFSFCVSNKAKILKEVNRVYNRQITTKKVYTGFVDFRALEQVCDNYTV